MDKVLAFSILSASPADLSASAGYGGRWARLSWRSGADSQQATAAWKEEEDSKEKQGGRDQERGARPAPAPKTTLPRFAPEFDGIDCFETIVSH